MKIAAPVSMYPDIFRVTKTGERTPDGSHLAEGYGDYQGTHKELLDEAQAKYYGFIYTFVNVSGGVRVILA